MATAADLPHSIEIVMKSGARYRRSLTKPRGSAKNPIGVEEYRSKFLLCCEGVLDAQQADQLFSAILDLDTQPDICFITARFAAL